MQKQSENASVWVFVGPKAPFPASVFTSVDKAEVWIKEKRLSGCLSEYPLDESIYDWAIKNDFFTPKKSDHHEPWFVQRFTSASQRHRHYEDGVLL